MSILNYVLAGFCVLCLIVAGVLWFEDNNLKLKNAQLQENMDQVSAELNAKALELEQKVNGVNNNEVAAALQNQNAQLQKQLEDINAIKNAPQSDDGPVAPVLRRTIDGLRQPSTPAARGASAGGTPASQPIKLPQRPAAAAGG